MQFGVDKHEKIFRRQQNCTSPWDKRIMLLLVNNVDEKTSQEVMTNEILKACALLVICTRITREYIRLQPIRGA